MESVFDFLNDHGWEGLLLLTLCGALIIGVKYISNKLIVDVASGLEKVGEKLTDQISSQNDKLVNVLLTNQNKMLEHIINQRNVDEKEHLELVNNKISFSEEINVALKDILNIHNAHRVFIIEFHNSQINLSGTPFAKYSCTHEYVAKGVSPIMNKCLDLPISQLSHIIKEVIEEPDQQKVYTDMVQMEEDNPILFALLKDTKTNAIVYNALYDKDNILIGMLVLEYQIPLEEANLQENQLKFQAAEITSILNLRYKHHK